VLDAGQLDVLLSYGTEQMVGAGEVLFAEGDKAVDLIAVLEGEVQIVVNAGLPTESVIVTYGPWQFVGEIALLTGQRAPVAAVARIEGRVLRVSAAQVRVIMAQESTLSELCFAPS
jgi:thioredoxin reductase (NADPH)